MPLIIALIGYWAVGFPVAWWLGMHTPLRGTGVWLGLAAGLAAVAVMLTIRWALRERLGLTDRAPGLGLEPGPNPPSARGTMSAGAWRIAASRSPHARPSVLARGAATRANRRSRARPIAFIAGSDGSSPRARNACDLVRRTLLEHRLEPPRDPLAQHLAIGVEDQPLDLPSVEQRLVQLVLERRQRPARRVQHRQRPDHPLRIGRLQPCRDRWIARRDQLRAPCAIKPLHFARRMSHRLIGHFRDVGEATGETSRNRDPSLRQKSAAHPPPR